MLYKLKKTSNWRAPTGSPSLETFINVNEMSLNNTKTHNISNQNITEGKRRALRNLSKDKSITIKPADKGGALVIQDTKDYVKEAHRQLDDIKTYRKLDKDPTESFANVVNNQLEDMTNRSEITPKIRDILKIKEPKTPQIYFLPKIHKNTLPPPGRPIVSANSCPTENISAFVDLFLNPLVANSIHHVKDTTDFLNKIMKIGNVPDNTIIGTLDVTSLYTNIPNNEGIQSISDILEEKRPDKNENPKNKSLIELLKIVLTKNNFQFNGQNYLQLGGTAMGTRVAPSYANLFMRKLEMKLLSNQQTKPTVWLRYIDDIFFVWEHSEEKLLKWHKNLNDAHSTIKFTMDYSTKQISFLDTLVKIDQSGNLYTDLFTKTTDSHSYLRYDSAHPPHCKKNLPYGQFLRLRRICSKPSDFLKHTKEMKTHFIERGYPKRVVDQSILRCKNLERNTLLEPKEKKDKEPEDNIFLVQTFRPCRNSLTDTIKKNWNILGKSKTTKNMYRSNLICSLKKPKCVRDYLVKARTNYDPNGDSKNPNLNTNECKKPNCKYCELLTKTGSITSKTTKEKFTTKHNVTCNSSNLIYCIECKKCNIQYVGQTKRKIKERVREHIYHTNKGILSSDVPHHFSGKTCSPNDMMVHILDFTYEHPDSKRAKSLRNTIEFNWVQRIKSMAPLGLNTQDNIYG